MASVDAFGRPLAHGKQEGDAALDADVAQSEFQRKQVRSGGWAAAYGGRRQAGQVQRGGLQSPLVLYTLPGIAAGYLLCLFLGRGQPAAPAGAAPAKKKKPDAQWAGPAPPPGAELKLVLVVRDDLGMSVGKTAAQCAHAAVGIVGKLRKGRSALLAAWEACGQTKITLKCEGIAELTALAQAAMAAGLPVEVIQDAGRTEVEPGTHTVLAIGPGTREAIDAVTGKLKLLR